MLHMSSTLGVQLSPVSFVLVEESAQILNVVDCTLENLEVTEVRPLSGQKSLESLNEGDHFTVLNEIFIENERCHHFCFPL